MEHPAQLRPRHLLMLGFLALSMACTKTPAKTAPLASSLEKPSPSIQVTRETKAISYPYSVVSGGVHGKEDLEKAIVQDPVVADHYKNSRPSEMEPAVLKEDRTAYVSYRVGDKVFWTARMVVLRRGERVFTVGQVTIRGRCGNQVSEVPRVPVLAAAFEPAAAEFDQPMEFRMPSQPDLIAALPPMLFANLPVAGSLQEESPVFESQYGDLTAFFAPAYFPGGYVPPVFFGGSSPSFLNSPIDSGTSPPNSGPVLPPSSNVPFPPGTIVVPPPIMPPPHAPQPPYIPIPIDRHPPETPVAPPGHPPSIPPVTPPIIPQGTTNPLPPGLPPSNPPMLPPVVVPPGIVPPLATPPHNPPELPPNSLLPFPPSEPPSTPNIPELNTYLLAASGFLAFGLLRYLVKDKNKPDDE